MWFTPNDILNKQRLFNFVTGPKGDGKTTGCRNYALDQWKKDNTFEFAVIRRYKREMQDTYKKYFDNINDKFNYGIDVKYKSRSAGITVNTGDHDEFKPICHFFALSTDAGIQGVNLPNLRFMIFEEFLLDPTKNKRYLRNEPEEFARLYDTLARPSDPARPRVPVIFIGNSFASSNPYYDFFKISLNSKGEFKNKNIYALHIQDTEFSEQAKNTEFGQIMANTNYGQHAFDNKFLLDNFEFVRKDFPKARLLFNFTYYEKTFGVWIDAQAGAMFVSSKYDPRCMCNYSFTNADQKANYLSARFFTKAFHGQLTKYCYNMGCLYFESLSIKNMWFEIARICNL